MAMPGLTLCKDNECEVRVCGKNRHKIPKGKEIFAKDIPLYGIEEYGKSQYLPYCLERECSP